MVKIYCDKCGREIKNRYYTINIYRHDTTPQPTAITAAMAATIPCTEEDMLQSLNRTKMYCNDCRAIIEAFINER